MLKYVYIVIAIILIAVVYGYITTDHRDDNTRITEVVTSIVAGANSRNLSQCMTHVSSDFKTESDINKDRLRLLVAQAFRSETHFNIEATLKSVTVSGDDAQAVVDVSISGWEDSSSPYARAVNVRLKKEPTRRMLVIPSNSWKVTYVDSLVVGGGAEQLF